jgi:DNA polymerase III alpha subunit (gram-positive type)
MSTIIYTDLEYLYPEMTRESGRPSSKDLRQIVQIAAIKVNENGVEISSLDILVKPTYTSQLPEFFIELTGITQGQIDTHAISLEEGIRKFIEFVGDTSVRTYHKDYEVWQQNAGSCEV